MVILCLELNTFSSSPSSSTFPDPIRVLCPDLFTGGCVGLGGIDISISFSGLETANAEVE